MSDKQLLAAVLVRISCGPEDKENAGIVGLILKHDGTYNRSCVHL